jgi:hypothetical protein
MRVTFVREDIVVLHRPLDVLCLQSVHISLRRTLDELHVLGVNLVDKFECCL